PPRSRRRDYVPSGRLVLRAFAKEEHAALQAPRLDLGDFVGEPLLDRLVADVVRVLAREGDVVVRVLLHGRLVRGARRDSRVGDVHRNLGELVLHLDPLRLALFVLLAAAGGQGGDQEEWGQASHVGGGNAIVETNADPAQFADQFSARGPPEHLRICASRASNSATSRRSCLRSRWRPTTPRAGKKPVAAASATWSASSARCHCEAIVSSSSCGVGRAGVSVEARSETAWRGSAAVWRTRGAGARVIAAETFILGIRIHSPTLVGIRSCA